MTMRGTKSGMSSHVKKVLKRAELKGKLVLVPVNESYTSKVGSTEASTNDLPSDLCDLSLDLLKVPHKQPRKQSAGGWVKTPLRVGLQRL